MLEAGLYSAITDLTPCLPVGWIVIYIYIYVCMCGNARELTGNVMFVSR